jgi:hypothetical protein
MKIRVASLSTIVCMMAFVAPALAQQGDVPPVIERYEIFINGVSAGENVTEIDVIEGDLVQVVIDVLLITDDDFDEDPDDFDIELFYEKVSIWIPFDTYIVPEGPPVPADTGFNIFRGIPLSIEGPNLYQVVISFFVPQFNGVNQARLRELIDYDVLWDVSIGIWNSENPEETAPVPRLFFDMFATENPALRPANNPPPFPDAGADATVEPDTTVELSGLSTFDSFNTGFNPADPLIFGADEIEYIWEWISGPQRVDPVYVDTLDRPWLATVDLDVIGTYVYRLTVTDGINPLPNTDTVTIAVVPEIPENRAPRAVVDAPDEPIVLGNTLTLDASASFDPDNDALTYRWRQTDVTGGDLPADEFEARFQALSGLQQPVSEWRTTATGTFYFLLIVSDGDLIDTELVSVEVVAAESAGTSFQVDPPRDGPATPLDDGPDFVPMCGAGAAVPLAALPFVLTLWYRGRPR